jgi:GNAT superfamily N-acetyltransferase
MEVRPLRPDDVAAADEIARQVFDPPGTVPTEAPPTPGERRVAHLLSTDPGGAWAAIDADGILEGVALALRRDDLWGLSLLAVRPDRHARGIGRRLLEAALAYADGARGRIVMSSQDPKAMRLYARAGLRLRPTVGAGGILDRSLLPPPAPDVGPSDDVAATAAISRAVRGATHHLDIPVLLERGMQLLAHSDRGFAVHDQGTPKLLAARDEQAATDLLWACLAAAPPGATVSIDFIAAEQDWAVGVALEAGLALTPDGPLFVAGELGPLRPYLPSSTYD